jgi:hypothetical protein
VAKAAGAADDGDDDRWGAGAEPDEGDAHGAPGAGADGHGTPADDADGDEGR